MSIQDVAEKMRPRVERSGFDRSVKFDTGADGVIVIDGATISTADAPADCTITLALDDLEALVAGELNPTAAFMQGKLKVEGDKLTGKASFERMGQKGEAELKDGKAGADEVSFVEMLDFEGTTVPIAYTGKVAADEIKFTRKVGDFATEEFVAKRVKP